MAFLWRPALVAILGSLYVSLFWFRPPSGWPSWLGSSRRFLIDTVSSITGWSGNWSWVAVSLICGAMIPLALTYALRKPSSAIFVSRGTQLGWRLTTISYLVAFISLLWLASRQEFRDYYSSRVAGGLLPPAARFVLVIIAEHICIQGIIFRLALGHVGRWPQEPPPVPGDSGWHRLRRFLGLGEGQGLMETLALNRQTIAAMAAQALVFGWVHVSKDVGELVLSFPGGFALGYLTWRSRSIWPCVVLHTMTGFTVIGLAILLYGLST